MTYRQCDAHAAAWYPRSMMRSLEFSFVVFAVASVSCVVGAPPGFSKGSSWTIPLLGTQTDGTPVTSVRINGKGPYLFRVSLDSPSVIDMRLMRELALFETRTNRKLVDDNDKVSHEQLIYADIPTIQLGDLTVKRLQFIAMKTDASYNGRPVLGTVGRNILSETLIWHLDRDRSVLKLAVRGKLSPPENATRIQGTALFNQFFTKLQLQDGSTVELVADFTGPSQLWPERAAAARLAKVTEFTDFYGRRRRAQQAWVAETVQTGSHMWNRVVFLPFADRRVDNLEYHGRLGNDFWSRFNLTVDWHKRVIWVQARERDTTSVVTDRLQRWMASCESPGCARVNTDVQAVASTTADGQRIERELLKRVVIERKGMKGQSFELLLQAIDAGGTPLAKRPWLLIVFPADMDRMELTDKALLARYTGAANFRIADMSPFPPPCDAASGCISLQRN